MLLILGFLVAGVGDRVRNRTASADVLEMEREVLRALYDSAGGIFWVRQLNWFTDAPLQRWSGITIDTSGRITALRLPDNRLHGWIPKEIGALANLEMLDLSGGFIDYSVVSDSGSSVISVPADFRLSGFIPRTLGNLSKLRVLDLSKNELSGGIPHELGNLSNLEVLDLRSNKLRGEIPSELGNLRKLNTLHLSHPYFWTNSWTGCVPAALQEHLYLGESNLGDLSFCADDGQ